MRSAARIEPGDRFVCHMTRLSRWVGLLEFEEGPFEDHTPFYYDEDDPYVMSFKVRPVVWLPKEKAIPIQGDRVWEHLSFTRDHQKGSSTWTGKLRSSLGELEAEDGELLEWLLHEQMNGGQVFEIDPQE